MLFGADLKLDASECSIWECPKICTYHTSRTGHNNISSGKFLETVWLADN